MKKLPLLTALIVLGFTNLVQAQNPRARTFFNQFSLEIPEGAKISTLGESEADIEIAGQYLNISKLPLPEELEKENQTIFEQKMAVKSSSTGFIYGATYTEGVEFSDSTAVDFNEMPAYMVELQVNNKYFYYNYAVSIRGKVYFFRFSDFGVFTKQDFETMMASLEIKE